MNRSLALVSILAGATVAPLVPVASASDVHVGLALSVPFEHGVLGVAFGNGRGYHHHHPGRYYHGRHHGGFFGRPTYGACVPWLPSSYVSVVVEGVTYFHDGAVYYQYTPAGYQRCPPPFVQAPPPPVAVTAAPAPEPEAATESVLFLPRSADMSGTLQLRLNGRTYFYDDGTFFQKTSTGYTSTPAPIGAIAQHLPGDAESMMLGDLEYFTSGPAVFRQVRNGFMLVDG